MTEGKLAGVSTTETLYKAGDIVLLRNDLEVGETYAMYGGVIDDFVTGMKKGEIVTITEVAGDSNAVNENESAYKGLKYYIDDSSLYMYTDEMIVGKLIDVDDYYCLTEGDLLLLTSDDTLGLEKEILGEIAKFKAHSPFGTLLELSENDVIVFPTFMLNMLIDGVIYNPLEFYCDLIDNENGDICDICSTEIKKENEELEMTEVKKQEALLGVEPEKTKPEVFIPEEYNNNGIIGYNIKVDKVVYNAPATIMFYRTGEYNEQGQFFIPEGSKQKKVVAKAQHGDVYNKQKGFAVCMYKMFNRESAKRLKQLSK